tara:strand:- start:305 stop:886 length:582 start_codon:yes stop_codon:yes gene_type:complete
MEGGMVVTNNDELFQLMLSLRSHGWTRNLPNRERDIWDNKRDPFARSFNFILPGYNLRPLEMSGALGVEQLKKFPNLLSSRRENAKVFRSLMIDHPKFITQHEIGESSWFGFSLVLRKKYDNQRSFFIDKLSRLGFECRPIVAGNFINNEAIKYFNFEIHQKLNNADYIDRNGLFIGNHHYPMNEAIEILAAC